MEDGAEIDPSTRQKVSFGFANELDGLIRLKVPAKNAWMLSNVGISSLEFVGTANSSLVPTHLA